MGMPIKKIVEKTGASSAGVKGVCWQRTWKHISKAYIPKDYRGRQAQSAERREAIYKDVKSGMTYEQVAKKYKFSKKWVQIICNKLRDKYGDPKTGIGYKFGRSKRKK